MEWSFAMVVCVRIHRQNGDELDASAEDGACDDGGAAMVNGDGGGMGHRLFCLLTRGLVRFHFRFGCFAMEGK